MVMKNRSCCVLFTVMAILSLALPWPTQANPALADKQEIYVPAYSHIYIGNDERAFLLTVTLSFRNIDPKKSLRLTAVDYYESQGKLLKKFLSSPITLGPLESIRYIIPEKEKVGGSGANFIVQWESDSLMNPPIAEAIMIGAGSGQGISFSSRGRVIVHTD